MIFLPVLFVLCSDDLKRCNGFHRLRFSIKDSLSDWSDSESDASSYESVEELPDFPANGTAKRIVEKG